MHARKVKGVLAGPVYFEVTGQSLRIGKLEIELGGDLFPQPGDFVVFNSPNPAVVPVTGPPVTRRVVVPAAAVTAFIEEDG